MNNKQNKLEQALIQKPKNSDAYQETLNIMYDYRTRSNATKLLKRSKDLLVAWKQSHDGNAPAFEAAQQRGTPVDRFYRRKLLERSLSGDNAGFYDLHHLQRGSAYYFIKNAIHELKEKIQHPSELKLIPGKGKHSFGPPVLKEIIIEICAETRLHFQPLIEKDGLWGKVLITVQPKKLIIVETPSSLAIDPAARLIQDDLKVNSLDNEDIEQTPTYPTETRDFVRFIEDDIHQAFTPHDIAKVMAGLDEDDIKQAPTYRPMAATMASLDEDDIEQAPTYPHMAATLSGLNEDELNQASTYPYMGHSLKANGLVQSPSSPQSISTSLSPTIKKQDYTPQLFKPWTSPLTELGHVHDKTKAKSFEFNIHAKDFVPASVQQPKQLEEAPQDAYRSLSSF